MRCARPATALTAAVVFASFCPASVLTWNNYADFASASPVGTENVLSLEPYGETTTLAGGRITAHSGPAYASPVVVDDYSGLGNALRGHFNAVAPMRLTFAPGVTALGFTVADLAADEVQIISLLVAGRPQPYTYSITTETPFNNPFFGITSTTDIQSVNIFSTDLAAPAWDTPTRPYWIGNLTLNAVPEPAILGLLGIGTALLIRLRRPLPAT